MSLIEREYMRETPRTRVGELTRPSPNYHPTVTTPSPPYAGGLTATGPASRSAVSSASPYRARNRGGGWLWFLGLVTVTSLVIWGFSSGTWTWGKLFGLGDGVHLCTVSNFAADRMGCTSDDVRVPSLASARLDLEQQAGFSSITFEVVVSKSDVKNRKTTLCTTTLMGAFASAKVAYHLDQVLAQCGRRVEQYGMYHLEVKQDGKSLGATSFVFDPMPASTVSKPLQALFLCTPAASTPHRVVCPDYDVKVRHSAINQATLEILPTTARFTGQLSLIVAKKTATTEYVSQGRTVVTRWKNARLPDMRLGSLFHQAHVPPVEHGATYRVTIYYKGARAGTIHFQISAR